MTTRLRWTAIVAFTVICSGNAMAQGLSATDMRPGDNPTALTEVQILGNTAKTLCLIHQVADTAEVRGKTFRNNMTGTLSIGRDLMARPGNQMLTYSRDPSLDNKLPIRIGTELYLLVMEKPGDQIDIEGGIIGVGSKLRFETGQWTSFLGQQYRNGGATIGNQGLELLDGTEKRNEGPAQKSPQNTGTLQEKDKVAESDLPKLEQALVQEIRNKGVGERFVIKEIMPQGGLPGSMTLVQTGKGSLNVQMEFPGDAMPIVNNQPFAFGNFCLHRFKGRVELDMKGDIYTFISEDDKSNRLTFVMVPGVGYVYLRGKGRVTLKDGREVELGR
jgi:hypothetical protein